MRALERDAARRFANAREFAIALEYAGAVALNREVGEWVAEIGGAALAERAEQVAEIRAASRPRALRSVRRPRSRRSPAVAQGRRRSVRCERLEPFGGSANLRVDAIVVWTTAGRKRRRDVAVAGHEPVASPRRSPPRPRRDEARGCTRRCSALLQRWPSRSSSSSSRWSGAAPPARRRRARSRPLPALRRRPSHLQRTSRR